MRILVVGSGGREHAILDALAKSPSDPDLLVTPGNAGMEDLAKRVEVSSDDHEGVLDLVREKDVDLTVVGPEKPLVEGLVDRLEEAGHAVAGPRAGAARLEGSKAFANAFMKRHQIPTAEFQTFEADEYSAATDYIKDHPLPVVVKADGLAGGKGSFVCETRDMAVEALDTIVQDRRFGAAGSQVVVEEYMEGEEASIFVLTDGTNYVVAPASQDHKRIGEGETGPNTGGMGAYAPAPVITSELLAQVETEVIEPTLAGMREEGDPYRGVLYCGLMITDEGPKVVEYNARLGDPEAQVVLPLVESDWVEIFQVLAEGEVSDLSLEISSGSAAVVILASKGYPVKYRTGFPITGLDEAKRKGPALIYHSGTEWNDDGELVTAGGRVVGVTGIGADLTESLARAYRGVEEIHFDGATYRTDIGKKGLEHLQEI